MLLDDNLVSIDAKAIAATVTGDAVALTSIMKPGRVEPIPCCVMVNEAAAGGTSVTIKIQQADSAEGSFTDVPGSSVTVALADMIPGKNIGPRFLPAGVTKQWIKFVVTAAGTFTAGKVSAFVGREDEFLNEAGMYIDKGVVLG
jgi:hypothetical protein